MTHYTKPKRPTPVEILLTVLLSIAIGYVFLRGLGVL